MKRPAWIALGAGVALGVAVGLTSLDSPPAVTLVDLLRQRFGAAPDGGFPPSVGTILDFSLGWLKSIPGEVKEAF